MAYNYDIPFHVDLTDRVALVTGDEAGSLTVYCHVFQVFQPQTDMFCLIGVFFFGGCIGDMVKDL